MRISSESIVRQLLAGDPLEWADPSTGRSFGIKLTYAKQRRLLKTLLGASSRTGRGLSAAFIQSLKEAYSGEGDPASELGTEPPSQPPHTQTWLLRRIEAYGFGGLTKAGTAVFNYELNALSACIEGANGSGKSSLIAAVTWALSGLRANDQFGPTASLVSAQPVLDMAGRQIGSWRPIAAYPDDSMGLRRTAKLGVRLTFYDVHSGQEAVCTRKLSPAGEEVFDCDPRLQADSGFDALVQIGVIMPCRLRHLRLGERGSGLSSAVQALTGLDVLSELGDFVAALCNGNQEFRRYARQQNQARHKDAFDRFISSAEKRLPRDTLQFDKLRDLRSPALLDDLRAAKTELAGRAAEHLKTLREDLIIPTTVHDHKAMVAAIELAKTEVREGIDGLPVVRTLCLLAAGLEDGSLDRLKETIERGQVRLGEAMQWRERQLTDSKLRLKVLAARWHKHHASHDLEFTSCPLCEQSLDSVPEVRTQLKTLQSHGELAEQTLEQSCAALDQQLRASWPREIQFDADYWLALEPAATIIAEIRERFVEADRYAAKLIGIARVVAASLKTDSFAIPSAPQSAAPNGDNAASRLERTFIAGLRLIELARWWRHTNTALRAKWTSVADGEATRGAASLNSLLTRFSEALSLTEPLQDAAASLDGAITAATAWREIQTEQEARDRIADAIDPLKELRAFVEYQTKAAINLLSARISEILGSIYLTDSLRYESTTIARQAVTVHGTFGGAFKIDAALVANTSWLRAVLWAFIFSLRQETLLGLQRNPLPLMMLDDPQTTFDIQHRRKWAELVTSLARIDATELNHAQFLITTHESAFVDNLRVEGFPGIFGTICGTQASGGGAAVILDGRRLDAYWSTAQAQRTPKAAQDYIAQVRIEVETHLRLILRGEGTDVPRLIWSDLRDRLQSLYDKAIPPYNRPQVKKLLGYLSASLKQVKLINWPHHFADDDVAYAQAVEIHTFWRKDLQPALTQVFGLQRDFAQMYGDRAFATIPRESCDLPKGHEEVLRRTELVVRGRAAAVTAGRVSDGRVSLFEFELGDQVRHKLHSHAAYVLAAPTLEPVATRGDILIVSHRAQVNPKNLVVVPVGDGLYARRFDLSEGNPELAIFAAQAVNPYEIAPPIAVPRAAVKPRKVVGVFYNTGAAASDIPPKEVVELEGTGTIDSYLRQVFGLYRVEGRSAEPYALDGQYLVVYAPLDDRASLRRSSGSMVLAIDEDDGHYFKRLRFVDDSTVVLESLDLSGREPCIVLGLQPGPRTQLKAVMPVVGVLFEVAQPTSAYQVDTGAAELSTTHVSS